MLVRETCKNLHIKPENLIVAHFDHGIREDSSTDEEFVRGVVGDYGLTYETARVELGVDVSEENAREARYNFLRQCCKKYNAQLVTAHHQDDLVETMLINLIRGTGWRGLVSLDSDSVVVRPLLTTTKNELLAYAKEHKLSWHEDSTNTDESYLRNYVRLQLLPAMVKKDPGVINRLIGINKETAEVKKEIATELQKIIPVISNPFDLPRHPFIMWPLPVSREVIYAILTQLDANWHPNSLQISRALHFIKTGKPHKELEVSGRLKITLTTNSVQFKNS
jgi:tRNA(Ile)-lysidine synthase